MPWYRGNTHTHTNVSDGDASPEQTIRWYTEHGYDWVAITDHNRFGPEDIPATGADFLVIPGSEISMSSEERPVHLCALNPRMDIDSTHMQTIVQTLQAGVDRTRSLGGVPIICHPNWNWAFTEWHMQRVAGWSLLEIFNASSDCNNFGAGGRPSVEDLWDRLLTEGMKIYGVASDDSHHIAGGEHFGRVSLPGIGWVCVRANALTADSILASLERGEFYSSTEVEFDEYEATSEEIRLRIRQIDSYVYTTRFIGAGGRVLSESYGPEAVYRFCGYEKYVRARVYSSNGGHAWCQPVFVRELR